MKSLLLATIAMMIFVAIQAADGKTEATSKFTSTKQGYMTARKFKYPRGTNVVKANDPSEKMNVAKFAFGNLPVEESKSENTASKININKGDDTSTEIFSNYNETPSTSSGGTHRSFPTDKRPGGHHFP
ncbi:hypothetical protein IFM89_034219 [Coptis chinensis]|uniref:Uncharacterized protein n=1 Tax=Coptis chinensis TaxID=261450 RepID=A0A835HA94_9MAGN|nr:hypothetical protein IFM89_034219 [Coptis chinensis]